MTRNQADRSQTAGMTLDAITADPLNNIPGIDHAFFARDGGASDGIYAGLNTGLGSRDDRETVIENRKRAARHLGVEQEKLATPYQVHSTIAVATDDAWTDENRPKADALVTDRPGLVIGIGTADCGPVLFAEPEAGIVGAAHAGWKGALGGILDETVNKIIALGGQRERIVAVLGPTISGDNYEVGPEFRRTFEEVDPENWQFFRNIQANGHAHFDLPAYIVARLTGLDLACAENINACTYADDNRFYSYRRATHRGEPDYGRLLSAITVKDER